MEKARIEIKNATVHNGKLTGTVFDHPKLGKHPEGLFIMTSGIVKYEGNVIETKNSIYEVQSWAVQPSLEAEM
jgi:hypothetical protein